MTKRELERLRNLLAKFSETTNIDDGGLRDNISWVIHAIDTRLED